MGKTFQEMNSYFTQPNETGKKSFIQMLKAFFRPRRERIEIDIEQYNKDIEEAEREIEAGNFITHEQLKQEMKKW